jgi:hypothetical protein
MRDLAADAASEKPVHLFPIPRALAALELIARETERIVEGDLDPRFFADLAAGGVSGALALLDMPFWESPFMTASYQKTRPLVDHDRAR